MDALFFLGLELPITWQDGLLAIIVPIGRGCAMLDLTENA